VLVAALSSWNCHAWLATNNVILQPGVQQHSLTMAPSRLSRSYPAEVRRPQTQHFVSTRPDQDDFVDVEFEPVDGTANNNKSKKKKRRSDAFADSFNVDDAESLSQAIFGNTKNLIDLSFETAENPEWQNLRIPFCQGDEYIDGKLAFMVDDVEGQSYGIAVPFDDAVALVVQETVTENGKSVTKTTNIRPDMYGTHEEYAELMEIFATQVQEQLGEEYHLRKTPKVLTISGGLDKITKGWEKTVVSKPIPVEDLLEVIEPKSKSQKERELDEFFEFMRQELGDEEFEKTMNGDDDLSDEEKELLKFFDVPKIGKDNMDGDSMEDLLNSISTDLKENKVSGAEDFQRTYDSAALKILGYTFKDSGKSYYLVKPLKPYTLVGRHMKEVKDAIRFQLLTPEEEKVLVPKLEKICETELKAQGLDLSKDLSSP
jgi:hypothetical protein